MIFRHKDKAKTASGTGWLTPAEEPADDSAWIRAAHGRFDAGKSRFFGSPDTMRDGGAVAEQAGDLGAALFFYAKAVDIAHTWVGSKPGQRSLEDDVSLFDVYATALERVHAARPGADLTTDWNNESGKYAVPLMGALARIRAGNGDPVDELQRHAARAAAVTRL